MTDELNTINPTEFELTQGTERGLNYDVSLLAKVVDLNLTADTTLGPQLDGLHNMRRIYRVKAIGAAWDLTLTTGVTGGFRFGTTIASLTETASGKIDYIGCIYNGNDARWDVVAVSKGY